MEERRKFVRIDAAWPVKFKILQSGEEKDSSRTTNVSAGGVRFYTNAVLNEGAVLELEMLIPADSVPIFSTGRVAWQGKVVWCRESDHKGKWPLEVGVEFTDMDAYDRERLQAYINKHVNQLKNRERK